MILSFKKQFPKKISSRSKIHSIREDPTGRWRAGRKIHFATGLRTKNYNQFASGECHSVQKIIIKWVPIEFMSKGIQLTVWVDGVKLTPIKVHTLASNDGFKNTTEFACWFNKDFDGKIIHWTDYRYE